MISSRFEDVVMTTFSPGYQTTKHWLIDESSHDEKQSAAIARRFCRMHRMKFKSIILHGPYDINGWQHEAIYGFDADCLKDCTFKD